MPPDSFTVMTVMDNVTGDRDEESEVIVRGCPRRDTRISHFFPDDC